MYLKYGKFSPDVKIGFAGASRNCFPREITERRMKAISEQLHKRGINPIVPDSKCAVIESKDDAAAAAKFFKDSGCSAAVLFLGNFSPEIEDACFVKAYDMPILLLAAKEENADTLSSARGDALCGLMSASLAIANRGLSRRVTIPQHPLVDAKGAAEEIAKFISVAKTVAGISNSTIGLFGPRPRDFESCNYNAASLLSIGVEVEELALFDLEDEIAAVKKSDADKLSAIKSDMRKAEGLEDDSLASRMAAYERAILNFRESKKLSGAATQCWTRQESFSGHVPCFVNSRLTEKGFPVACENDAYSLVAELMSQYASDEAVTMLDINHTIPADMLAGIRGINVEDVVGLFHCGNVPAKLMKSPRVCHQLIMSRLMEPDKTPDITRGTLEGTIKPSDITLFQIHGSGDKLRAYICEGSFLDIDAGTFGSVGTAHIPNFMPFYRNCLLGRFHHHAAVSFKHCGGILLDALRQLGVEEIYTPKTEYPDANPFAK